MIADQDQDRQMSDQLMDLHIAHLRAGGKSPLARPGRDVKRPPCPCPACLGEVYAPWRRMRHTLVDALAPRVVPEGDLRQARRLDLQVDTEARATWARLGQ